MNTPSETFKNPQKPSKTSNKKIEHQKPWTKNIKNPPKNNQKHRKKTSNTWKKKLSKTFKKTSKTFKNLQRLSETFKNNHQKPSRDHVPRDLKRGVVWIQHETSQDDHSMYHVNPLDICYILLWHDVSKICRYIFHQNIPSTRFWKIFFLFFDILSIFCVFLFLYFSIFLQTRLQNRLNMTLTGGKKKRVKTGALNIFQLCFFFNQDWKCTIFYLRQDDYMSIYIYTIIYIYSILYIWYIYIDIYIYRYRYIYIYCFLIFRSTSHNHVFFLLRYSYLRFFGG